MKGLIYQLKSVRKDKFCIMSFLLPIVVAVALNFVGSIDLSSLGEFHFGVTGKGHHFGSQHMAGTVRYCHRLSHTGRTDCGHQRTVNKPDRRGNG